ncbi:hypothetical protein BKA56DRAFT_714262, partial [Ilyonectria sp. MPI-CAGE-AT-0026]
ATRFLELITTFRDDDCTNRRPIIFLGHSLGGLIIKSALCHAHNILQASENDFLKSVYAILFFGVPHQGMRSDALDEIVQGQPNRALIQEVVVEKEDRLASSYLGHLERDFARTCRAKYEIVSFYELYRSSSPQRIGSGPVVMEGAKYLTVNEASATLGSSECNKVALETDHTGLVKFTSRSDVNYTTVKARLRKLVGKAKPKVAKQGTCKWLLRNEVWLKWADLDRSSLWIKGKPGSGKSTLLCYALQEVSGFKGPGTLSLRFFFNDRGHDLEKRSIGLFRAVLHQLLYNYPEELPELIDSFQEKLDVIGKPNENWEWELWELRVFFKSSLARILKKVPVVLSIDALDECEKRQAEELLEYIDELCSNIPPSPFHFNVVIACREQPIWSPRDELTIKMHVENKKDIEGFVRARFSRRNMLQQSEAMELIIERANGIFLWASLICDTTIDLWMERASPALIKERIQRTPQELSNMYRKVIDGIYDEERLSAMWVMIEWILFAARPLSPNELRWAMAVDAESPHKSLKKCAGARDFILDDSIEWRIKILGCGLVEIIPPTDSEGPIVQFIHESVRDFFLDNRLSAKANESRGHLRLARSCIRYLKMKEISQSETLTKEELENRFPLLRYAVSSWPSHVRQGNPTESNQENLMELLKWPSESFLLFWTGLEGHRPGYSPPRHGV